MSTIQNTRTATGNSRAVVINWPALAAGDVGEPIGFSQYTDKSVQVTGNFGGASALLEGSNDGTTWATLTDPQGNPLSITAAKIEMVTEATLLVRPRVSGGDGSTAINVHLLIKE